ncbi:MAG TPA: deoxyuridine 5'-triphosphate nucleotidohydrolase [Spirochaetia bacterium]|nr:deoxyuridine 5'-triphosphate nucleotidohydrolase [Spirochaetia bacterium]
MNYHISNFETIKIKYISDIEKIKPIKNGNWIDLRSSQTIELKAGEWRLIPLGIAIKLPYGYEAHIVPRSSTFKNFGIIQTNHFGIVDNNYNGNKDQWYFSVYALRDTKIEKNDRICQFRIMQIQPSLFFEEVDDLGNENRGGFGSTGIK